MIWARLLNTIALRGVANLVCPRLLDPTVGRDPSSKHGSLDPCKTHSCQGSKVKTWIPGSLQNSQLAGSQGQNTDPWIPAKPTVGWIPRSKHAPLDPLHVFLWIPGSLLDPSRIPVGSLQNMLSGSLQLRLDPCKTRTLGSLACIFADPWDPWIPLRIPINHALLGPLCTKVGRVSKKDKL